jgi:iron(III) transport system ATP-binding protein
MSSGPTPHEQESEGAPLRITDLTKAFPGGPLAADHLDLEVEDGALFTLLGPSGSGKTTTLRCVAGLETPDSGTISVGDREVYSSSNRLDVPPNKRGIGMVFQSYAIWPHMTVFENAAFPLTAPPRRRRLDRQEIRRRVDDALSQVQLTGLGERSATKLSGGQQQRLALARALVMRPRLLLLDEPLSNLDAKLRDDMRLELKRLQNDLGVTTLYVTHDQVEALAISDRIGVMDSGRLVQVGTPDEIYLTPATRFVAEFIGASNFVPGEVMGVEGTNCVVRTAAGSVTGECVTSVSRGDSVVVSLRPEMLGLTEVSGNPADPAWSGAVRTQAYLGEAVDHLVDLAGGLELRVRTGPGLACAPGISVRVDLDRARARVFPTISETPPEPPDGSDRPTQPVAPLHDVPATAPAGPQSDLRAV